MKFKFNWRQYIKKIYLVAAIALFGLGGFVAYVGNESANVLLIALGFGGLAGGFMLFLAWRQQGDIRHVKTRDKSGEEYKPPNSLNLYPDQVEFAYVAEPKGQQQKCLNDGKYYYVYLQNLLGELEELRLPDDDEKERYYDPTEFANPVTMPSNKKYFTWSISTMQKISIGVIALIIVAEIIGLVIVGG